MDMRLWKRGTTGCSIPFSIYVEFERRCESIKWIEEEENVLQESDGPTAVGVQESDDPIAGGEPQAESRRDSTLWATTA